MSSTADLKPVSLRRRFMKSIGLHSNSVPSSVTPTSSRENNSNSALPGTSPSVILSSTNLQPSSQLKLLGPSPKAPSRSTPAPDGDPYSGNVIRSDRESYTFSLLKEIVATVKEVSDVFPPLKSAASGFLVALERIDKVKRLPDEVTDTIQTLEQLVEIIKAHKGEGQDSPQGGKWLDERIDKICRIVDAQTRKLDVLLDRGMMNCIVEAPADVEAVAEILQKICSLRSLFTLDVSMRTNVVVEDIRRTVAKVAREIDTVQEKTNQAHDAATNLSYDAIQEKLCQIPNKTGCLPGTRVDLLDDLIDWARDPEAARVYWLNGMAGTGKTTIAVSFIHRLLEESLLGGWFLCSRANGQAVRDVKNIFPSLSDSLASVSSAFREARVRVYSNKPPNVHVLSLEEQFGAVLEEPLLEIEAAKLRAREDAKTRQLAMAAQHRIRVEDAQEPSRSFAEGVPDHEDTPTAMLVFVIDALDECDDRDATEDLLRIVLRSAPYLRIKFFLASRPERHIRDALRSQYPHILRLHDVDRTIVQDDIGRYLRHELTLLARRKGLGENWPPERQLNILASRAAKFFIYASTAVKYISLRDHRRRLQRLIDQDIGSTTATEPIHAIYTLILEETFAPLEPSEALDVKQCLSTIVLARQALTLLELGALVGLHHHRVISALESLHSLIRVPENTETQLFDGDMHNVEVNGGCVTTFHESFPDYLQHNGQKHNPWFIDSGDTHLDLARQCLNIMSSKLHFNMTRIPSSSLDNDTQSRVMMSIPPEVSYACQYWQDHLFASRQSLDLWAQLEQCLLSKFLYWVEVLSVQKRVQEGATALQGTLGVYKLRSIKSNPTFIAFLDDAHIFLTDFREPITLNIAHIYISALFFCAVTQPSSQISKLYSAQFPPTLAFRHFHTSHGCRSHSSSRSLDDQDSLHDRESSAVRYWSIKSSNETLVSPSANTRSGIDSIYTPLLSRNPSPVSCQTLGHTGSVICVAFSPDGNSIVSGSSDCTIRVWDLVTGEVSCPFKGHTSTIWSVAFSPFGDQIASSSSDGTIRIWDSHSGDLFRLLDGGVQVTPCVAFLPHGGRVVSCSSDWLIHVWDIESGQECTKPFKGHSDWVSSVAVSGDGRSIVSGSKDCTVRIWDSDSGEAILQPLTGHTAQVWAVAYSPDGEMVLSGSQDGTIRAWDVNSGQQLSKLNAHKAGVSSIALPFDGSIIVSGSADRTIRVWDAESKEIGALFVGHGAWVSSVAVSPNGRWVVSGSGDTTLRLWDVAGFEDSADSNTLIAGNPFDSLFPVPDSLRTTTTVASQIDSSPLLYASWLLALQPTGHDRTTTWLVTPDRQLILWVPPHLRDSLLWPGCRAILGRPSLHIDFSHFKSGTRWAENFHTES